MINWNVIGALIMRIINFILQKKERTERDTIKDEEKTDEQKQLDFDNALMDAIKRGDGEEVARLREKKRRYPNLLILTLFCLITTSCRTNDIPLCSGDIPYQLSPGQYTDSKGIIHNEKDARWSVSEQFLFESIRDMKPLKK
jgi:hypothetical protein